MPSQTLARLALMTGAHCGTGILPRKSGGLPPVSVDHVTRKVYGRRNHLAPPPPLGALHLERLIHDVRWHSGRHVAP
jgi:hypothetical protein